MSKNRKKRKEEGFLSWLKDEIRDFIFGSILFRIILFIPRMIIRLFKEFI
ncbi:hypothetical protein ACSVDE_01430 [Pseudalkalibacillus sp. Hm43]